MYGYLTLGQCEQLEELGYAVVCDADNQDTYIRDLEKEYIASKIPGALEIIRNIFDGIFDTFKGCCKAVGEAFIKLSEL